MGDASVSGETDGAFVALGEAVGEAGFGLSVRQPNALPKSSRIITIRAIVFCIIGISLSFFPETSAGVLLAKQSEACYTLSHESKLRICHSGAGRQGTHA